MTSLTNEQINRMGAGREIDALVEEIVMRVYTEAPCYSTDIRAAWQVVEKLNNKLALQGPHTTDLGEAHVVYPNVGMDAERIYGDECNTYWTAGFSTETEDYPGWFEALAPTPQLAICRSALKAVLNVRTA